VGIGINPMLGTYPNTIVIAASTPAMTIRSVVSVQGPTVDVLVLTLLKIALLCDEQV